MTSRSFLEDDFLLSGETARSLFHDAAEHAPIFDFHNHLSPVDVAGDRVYETLSDLWLGDDHYKWRAMRLAGFGEQLVTGDADPWDRFLAWAATMPRLVRSPLYVWSHLELRRVFGIDLVLDPSTAREVWDEANRQMPRWSTLSLLEHFGVRALATTDDPGDDLEGHHRHRESAANRPLMIPTFRPDAAFRLLTDPTAWREWAERLAVRTGVRVVDLESLLGALGEAHARFRDAGSRASDHGLACLPDAARDPRLADQALEGVRRGLVPDRAARDAVALEVLTCSAALARIDGSVLQLHLGPSRDVSARVLELAGRDAGGDVMGDDHQGGGLARFLGGLEREAAVPNTLLYNLNPADDALFATMTGAFTRPGASSPVQWGPPWWFNDHEGGLRRQLDGFCAVGLLADFVGMTTDSRSLLSLTRHELFRRVLCDVIGDDVETGRIPADDDRWRRVVADVCFTNAAAFFGLPPDT